MCGQVKSASVQMRMARHVIDALAALHRLHIVHGEICPATVLFRLGQSGNKRFKLSGFRNARPYSPPEAGVQVSSLAEDVPASVRPYCAPERLNRDGVVTEKSDMFAYGLLAAHCLTGRLPHRKATGEMDAGAAGSEVPSSVLQLLHECMRPLPEQRPTAHSVEKRFGLIMKELERSKSTLARGAPVCPCLPATLHDLFTTCTSLHVLVATQKPGA